MNDTVAAETPLHFALTADTTGTPTADGYYTTGNYGIGLLVQYSKLFDSDHMMSNNTSPRPITSNR